MYAERNPPSINEAVDRAIAKEASPTGVPVLPPAAVPWLVGLVGLATVATQTLPEHTVAFKVASLIVGLGGLFGLASPGLRRK